MDVLTSLGVDSLQPLILAQLSSTIVHPIKYLPYQDKLDIQRVIITLFPPYNGLQIHEKKQT